MVWYRMCVGAGFRPFGVVWYCFCRAIFVFFLPVGGATETPGLGSGTDQAVVRVSITGTVSGEKE